MAVELKITGMTVGEKKRLDKAARRAFSTLDPGNTLSDSDLCAKGLLSLASGLVSDMDRAEAEARARNTKAFFPEAVAIIPIT